MALSGTTVVVSNATDLANGDVSSVDALLASPGEDGISLRESLLAINNSAGPHAGTFAPELGGQVIALTSGSLAILQDGVTLRGLVDADGSPAITIDGSMLSGTLLFASGSEISIAHLIFSEFASFAMQVRAGEFFDVPTAQDIAGIRIEDNVFSNSTVMGNSPAISVGTDWDAVGASVGGVVIARNEFEGLRTGDQVGAHIQAGGANNRIYDVQVVNNVFTDVTFGVEFVAANASESRIENGRIEGNRFAGNLQPVNLASIGSDGAPATSGNVIDGTLITGNFFAGNRGPDVVLLGGMTNATGNAITGTDIVNNVMTGSTQYGGVSVVGGRAGGSVNSIDGVRIANNTITGNVGGGVDVSPNLDGATGNAISGVSVLNSIFYANSMDFVGLSSSQVSYSLTSQWGFAQFNGNVPGDPLFVDSANGDFHLQPGSPAIDAGMGTGAPGVDADYLSRADEPDTPNTGAGTPAFVDIGAFEFAGGLHDDFLESASGDDTLNGGPGADTASYAAAGAGVTLDLSLAGRQDTIGHGVDTLMDVENLVGSGHDDVLAGNAANNLLNGLEGNDVLSGGAGADTLDGGAGADSMAGGGGGDSYVVDEAGDVVTELAGAGRDTVVSSIAHVLPAEVENLTLTGASAVDGTGNLLANRLIGNAAANTLRGNAGGDTLDGGAGADLLIGGNASDVYVVDDAGDVVSEAGTTGTDWVLSSVSFTLPDAVEYLTLTGSSAINGTGNSAANLLLGNAAANVLDGLGGADTMKGAAGDDTYYVDNSADRVVELAGAGNDTVNASASFGLGANVENLILTGGAAINGTGNAIANTITGNDAANVLVGMGGADTLSGGLGNDSLKGGTGNDELTSGDGNDVFFFVENPGPGSADVITDFASGADRMRLDDARFTAIGALGNFALNDARFVAGAELTGGQDADDRIVYNSTTGALYYDADGDGACAGLLDATLQGAPALAAADFVAV